MLRHGAGWIWWSPRHRVRAMKVVDMTDFYRCYDTGTITHEFPPADLVEGIDYVYDDVIQADGTVRRTMIFRQRP